jgi:S-adenosyl-L-methionine hydrolase (adenosine-forming)
MNFGITTFVTDEALVIGKKEGQSGINIDRFGNARLSVMQEDLDLPYDTPLEIGIRDEVIEARYVETFGSAEDGDLVAVPDSHWRLSLAVNRGNAARALLLSVGDEVRLKPSAEMA